MANVGGHGIHAQMIEFDEERADELVDVYRAHNMTIYREVAAFPGIVGVLERLRSEERHLGVVTVKSRATVEVTFEVLPLRRYFGAVVTGDDTVRHKPDPEPLLLGLDRLGADRSSAVYVGDSPFDIQAAKAAGIGGRRRRLGWHPLSGEAHPRATGRPRRASRGAPRCPLSDDRRRGWRSSVAWSSITTTATTSSTILRSRMRTTTACSTS